MITRSCLRYHCSNGRPSARSFHTRTRLVTRSLRSRAELDLADSLRQALMGIVGPLFPPI